MRRRLKYMLQKCCDLDQMTIVLLLVFLAMFIWFMGAMILSLTCSIDNRGALCPPPTIQAHYAGGCDFPYHTRYWEKS